MFDLTTIHEQKDRDLGSDSSAIAAPVQQSYGGCRVMFKPRPGVIAGAGAL